MLRPPQNSHFEFEQMNKVQFLTGVLGRLRNDAGNYIEHSMGHFARTGEGIGFWGSVRLLMPVVEAISNASPQYENPAAFLRDEMHIKTPNLMWILYRHSLMHNDLVQHGKYDGVDATWGISMFGQDHIIQDEHVNLDTLKFYNDLVAYLEDELADCDETDEVTIIRGVIWDNPSQTIIDEFQLIAPDRTPSE